MNGFIIIAIISIYYFNINFTLCETKKYYYSLHDYSECIQECLKISKTNRCYCDKQCVKYEDCCELFSVKCRNIFYQMIKNINDSSVNNNSCCSTNPNSDCFCDSKCVEFNDCCEDYQKCDDISIDKSNPTTKKVMKRKNSTQFSNADQYKEGVSNTLNALIKIDSSYSEESG